MFRPYGRDPPGVQSYFDQMESAMLALGGRPHWAKAFNVRGAALRALFPAWGSFAAVRERLDPQRVLWNEWAERVIGDAM
jgi:FAD/FMN-containing dehydrogenase